jgi:hypothetical protein
LGSPHTIGLADAHSKAAEWPRFLFDGIDLIDLRQAERSHGTLGAAMAITFKLVQCNDDMRIIERADANTGGWCGMLPT